MIWYGEMFGHWLLDSLVLDVQSMACQTNAECILHFSNVLNSTSSALNQVHHVASTTVRNGFHAKSRASCCAAKHPAHFYMGTCFTAWMFTRTVPLVSLSLLFERRPDHKVLQIRRTVICYKGTLEVLLSDKGIYWWLIDGLRECASEGEDLGGKSDN